jgi:uncharacterized protein YndB with AHSA1/START domain
MPAYLITNRIPPDFRPSPEAFAAWTAWFGQLGSHLEDRGNPAFTRATLGNCGPDTTLGGYSIITADTLESAVTLAESHPLMRFGGGVEIGELTPINTGKELAEAATPAAASSDYRKTIRVKGHPGALFDALTSVSGLAAWWTGVTGSGEAGGELKFYFGSPEPCVMHVDQATRPASVQWTVTGCGFLPDWVGTRPVFTITPDGDDASELRFRHHGLTAELDCVEQCTRGWDHYLASLREYVETGHGSPRGSSTATARRV